MSMDHSIAVDAMGGDFAPEQIVMGAIDSGIPVKLVGPVDLLERLLTDLGKPDKVEIVNATEIVAMDENPITATRTKKDSSLLVGIRLVRDGEAAGMISAGNTGAFTMGAGIALGRLTEIVRPGIAIPIPTPVGQTLFLDAGASADSNATDLVNLAIMGSTYARHVWAIENPRIGLLSIGEEESKGSKRAREAHQYLKTSGLNFIGNVQGSDIGSSDMSDVIVTDGFTGNVVLKAAEGVSSLIMQVVKDELKAARGLEKLATWVLYPVLKRIKKRLDYQEYGGGSLLGVNGNVVIAHGKSKRRAVASAIKLAHELAKTDLVHKLEDALKEFHKHGRQEPAGSEKGSVSRSVAG